MSKFAHTLMNSELSRRIRQDAPSRHLSTSLGACFVCLDLPPPWRVCFHKEI